jgi:hypothetical protein
LSYTREARILRGFACGWQIFGTPAAMKNAAGRLNQAPIYALSRGKIDI